MDSPNLKSKIGQRKTAFVAILDWGLGHATRSIPIIRELQKQNVKVIVGGSGPSHRLLKDEFPDTLHIDLPSYRITYASNGSLMWSLLTQLSKILTVIKNERQLTEELIEREKINFIISDNRYGCFSTRVKSVFVCHQLNLQLPKRYSFLTSIVNNLHLSRIKNFDEIWIPDQESGFRFSGILTNTSLQNIKRIGILSRFLGYNDLTSNATYEMAAIISGPEPQRTIFENLIRTQLIKSGRKSIMIKGIPGVEERINRGSLVEVNHLNSIDLESVLHKSKVTISRAGYSTVMDLAVIGAKAIFVPTPGQTEQEYLGRYLMDGGYAFTQSQRDFDLNVAFAQLDNIKVLPKVIPNVVLNKVIQQLI